MLFVGVTVRQSSKSACVVTMISTISGALTMVISGAAAQSRIDEVIVTATRRGQSLEEIPYSISAISGREILDSGIANLSDLMRLVPGATYSDHGPRSGINNSTLVLRGINAEPAVWYWAVFPTAPVVSTYINETPLYVQLRLRDIDRVEVLRGPQGTLYGSGSLGGSVRYIYNQPLMDEFSAEVSGAFGQYKNGDGSNYEADLVLNIPFGDTIALRTWVGKSDYAGFVDNVGLYQLRADGSPDLHNGSTDPTGDADNFFAGQPIFTSAEGTNDVQARTIRAALRWQPNEKFDATLSYHHQDDEAGSTPFVSEQELGHDTFDSLSVVLEPADRDVNIWAVEAEYDFGVATLSGSLSRYETEGAAQADQTGFLSTFALFPFLYGGSPRPLSLGFTEFEEDGTTFEGRLTSSTQGPLEYTVGVYYSDQNKDGFEQTLKSGYHDYATSCFILGNPVGGTPCGLGTFYGLPGYEDLVKDQEYVLDQDNDFIDRAVFGELTWRVSDSWQITGGVRYYDQGFATVYTIGVPIATGETVTTVADLSERGTVAKLNTSVTLNDHTMAYAVWSEGFRRGGANGLPPVVLGTPTPAELDVYTPDQTENRELGVKGSFGDRRFRYTATYFDIDWSNIQSNLGCTPVVFACVYNPGDASSRGFELSLQGQISDRLNFTFAYTHQKSVLDTISDSTRNLTESGALAYSTTEGKQLPGSPDNSIYLGGAFTQPLARGNRLVYSIDGSYRDEVESSLNNAGLRADDFWLWNASVTLRMDNWSVSALAKNVTDERGYTAVQSPDVFGFRGTSNMSAPRSYELRFSYKTGRQ